MPPRMNGGNTDLTVWMNQITRKTASHFSIALPSRRLRYGHRRPLQLREIVQSGPHQLAQIPGGTEALAQLALIVLELAQAPGEALFLGDGEQPPAHAAAPLHGQVDVP